MSRGSYIAKTERMFSGDGFHDPELLEKVHTKKNYKFNFFSSCLQLSYMYTESGMAKEVVVSQTILSSPIIMLTGVLYFNEYMP